jgi:hypothetical protein
MYAATGENTRRARNALCREAAKKFYKKKNGLVHFLVYKPSAL